MNMLQILQVVAITALLWAPQKPLPVPNQNITLETIDLQADAGLEDVHPDHLTRSLTQRHWDEGDWMDELKQLVTFAWQQHGYFKAVAEVKTRKLRESGPENIYAATVSVRAGKQYRLDDIRVLHPKQFTAEHLRAVFPLETGDVFNVSRVHEGVETLRHLYESRGFIKYTAVPETQIDEVQNRISLTIDVDEGPQFRLAEIKVLGLDSALADKLLLDSGMKAGDIYLQSAVEDFFTRNKNVLPPGVKAEDDTIRKIDEQNNTISLVFDFRNL